VISHLEYLKIWPGRKVIVMPCLIELGSSSEKIHYEIGEAIGQICNLAVITTEDRFEEIKKGALKNGMKRENILFLENSKQIFEKIKSFCKRGDVILLEGRVQKELINLLRE
jgi:UDP-N-acetylmuramoyl-tripeptide--D-alanyl-D-alanine ligase